MYTHALGLMALEDTIPYLCNLATGQDPNSSPTLRMGAIYSLSHHFNRGEKREKVRNFSYRSIFLQIKNSNP